VKRGQEEKFACPLKPAVGLPGKQKIIAGKWGLPAARMRGGWVVE